MHYIYLLKSCRMPLEKWYARKYNVIYKKATGQSFNTDCSSMNVVIYFHIAFSLMLQLIFIFIMISSMLNLKLIPFALIVFFVDYLGNALPLKRLLSIQAIYKRRLTSHYTGDGHKPFVCKTTDWPSPWPLCYTAHLLFCSFPNGTFPIVRIQCAIRESYADWLRGVFLWAHLWARARFENKRPFVFWF